MVRERFQTIRLIVVRWSFISGHVEGDTARPLLLRHNLSYHGMSVSGVTVVGRNAPPDAPGDSCGFPKLQPSHAVGLVKRNQHRAQKMREPDSAWEG